MTTPILDLEDWESAQAQPEVTVNEAVRWLECFSAMSVASKSVTVPPAGTDGDRYIVANAATGVWAGHDDEIALFMGSAWAFRAAPQGTLAYVVDESTSFRFLTGAWTEEAGGIGPEGPQGDPGADGATGATGAAGADGVDGITDLAAMDSIDEPLVGTDVFLVARDAVNYKVALSHLLEITTNDVLLSGAFSYVDSHVVSLNYSAENVVLPMLGATLITDATTARTLVATDAGAYLRMTSASANSVTVPPEDEEDLYFPETTQIRVRQAGTGVTTLVAGAGVTLNGSLVFAAQHDTKTLRKIATDEWDVIAA